MAHIPASLQRAALREQLHDDICLLRTILACRRSIDLTAPERSDLETMRRDLVASIARNLQLLRHGHWATS